jgi:hypothetical protein
MILQIKFTGKDKYTNLKYIHILYFIIITQHGKTNY